MSKLLRIVSTWNFVLCCLVMSLCLHRARVQAQSRLALVDPFVGVDGGGNVTPGAQVPFGFVSLGPDTTHSDTNGYSSRGLITGFSHTHESGTGGQSKYGNFRISPTVGSRDIGNLQFIKSEESAHPGYYSVVVSDPSDSSRSVLSELTAARLVGVSRFTFPRGVKANIILDAGSHIRLGGNEDRGPDGVPDKQQRLISVEVRILDSQHISGTATFAGGWNPARYTLHFFGEFNRPFESSGTWNAGTTPTIHPNERYRRACSIRSSYRCSAGLFTTFNTDSNASVELRLAVSFVSVNRARQNLQNEVGKTSFDEVRQRAQQGWLGVLNRIDVEGGDQIQRSILYTSLYRAHTMPHDLSGDNAWWNSKLSHYEDFYCIWDTFRTVSPLITILEPDRQRAMINSLLDTYKHTGWLPDARIAGSNGLTQGGSNGDVLIADAIVKNLGGFDTATAYAAVHKNAVVSSPRPLYEGRELDEYKALGYLSLREARSASRTVEYAYDDFSVAQVAEVAGDHKEAVRLYARSSNWKHLWDKATQCIRPRYPNGEWIENFDCSHDYGDGTTTWWDSPYYEGRPWQYSTYVPQATDELISLIGGKLLFTDWLDRGFKGGLYTLGNEPDFLAPYLYINADRPDRTSEEVRKLLRDNYKLSRSGLPGNDDSGALSSWFIWSALGLYPNAGQSWYYLGSPVFSKAVLHLGNDKTFTILAPGSSEEQRYVTGVTLNGKQLNRMWITHEELLEGGSLTFDLSAVRPLGKVYEPVPKWAPSERKSK